MRTGAVILAFLLWLNGAFFLELVAAEVRFSSSGLSGAANVSSVGPLKAKNGAATITGNRIDILFDSVDLSEKAPPPGTETDLTGTLFGVVPPGKSKTVEGFCWFGSGTRHAELTGVGNPSDTITTSSGTTVTGHITTCTETHVAVTTDIGPRNVPITEITQISSPSVFRFSVPLATDGAQISFEPTFGRPVAQAKVTTDKAPSKVSSASSGFDRERNAKRVILTTVVLLAVATAIAVPIAVACSRHHHKNRNDDVQRALLFNSINAQRREVDMVARTNALLMRAP